MATISDWWTCAKCGRSWPLGVACGCVSSAAPSMTFETPKRPHPVAAAVIAENRQWDAARLLAETYNLAIDPELAEWLRRMLVVVVGRSLPSPQTPETERG